MDFQKPRNLPKARRSRSPRQFLPKWKRQPLFFQGTKGLKLSDRSSSSTPVVDEYDFGPEFRALEWDSRQTVDFEWYDCEETSYVQRGEDEFSYKDQDYSRKAAINLGTLKKLQRTKDNEKWEINRMISSGVLRYNQPMEQLNQQDQTKVALIVNNIKPPFLQGRVVFTAQNQAIQVVKNPLSDIALLAKKGSAIVKVIRQRNQRNKMRDKFWDISNTTKTDQQHNYKADSQYASSFKTFQPVSDFAMSKSIQQQREYLPVFSVKDQLLNVIRENKVVIIVGQTGSGKTTQLTQYLLEQGFARYGTIGCTQPRRVAAVSVAKRVSQQLSDTLGNLAGYAIRFQDCTSERTKIKYMTDGVLLRESLNQPELDTYSAIIMDQAHQRSLHTDVLFGILKKVVMKRRDLKLIITSATMNALRFSDFFGGVPIFNIPGRAFPVQLQFSKTPVDDYVDSAVKKAITVHLQQPPGDILIFMTGQQDIMATCVLLNERILQLGSGAPQMKVLPIYSQLPSENQAQIFQKSEIRKCVIATNIAETSLTLDGVKYVIDTGFCKLKVFNPKIGMDALQITPISQANANQRSGRAGRTGPGVCYRLYTDTIFREDLLQNNIPQIQRTNLANVVLLLKSLNIDELLQFDFMDPPPQDNIFNSMYQLWILGALDNKGSLTELGRKMVEFPLDPPLSKMLLQAQKYHCTCEILTIVSMLSVPSVFYRPKQREIEADSAKQKFFVLQSDHLTLLNVYNQWKNYGFRGDWASAHFIHIKALRRVQQVRSQLVDILNQLHIPQQSCGNNWNIVRKVITSGYFHNSAKIKSIGQYQNLRTGTPCVLHPSSALFNLGYAPQYIVYHQLTMTTRQYMQYVTTVDPYWLAELGPMFFSVKQNFND